MIVTVVQVDGTEVMSNVIGVNDDDATAESVSDYLRDIIADRRALQLQIDEDEFVVFPYEQIRRIVVRS